MDVFQTQQGSGRVFSPDPAVGIETTAVGIETTAVGIETTAVGIETTAVTIQSLSPAVGIETLPVDASCGPQACVAYQHGSQHAISVGRRNNLTPFSDIVPDTLSRFDLLRRDRRTERPAWLASRLRQLPLAFLLHAGILTGDKQPSRYLQIFLDFVLMCLDE